MITAIPDRSRFLLHCATGPLVLIGGWTLCKKLFQIGGEILATRRKRKLMSKYAKESVDKPDVVILHQLHSSIRIPNRSGFALKLETFLRLANIQYEIDTQMPKADNDKTPWITLNGEHYTDSQLIVEMLERKLGSKIGYYSEEDRAVASTVRIMMEEHFYWGLILWRYVYSEGSNLNDLVPLTGRKLKAYQKLLKEKYAAYAWCQGLGRLDKEQVVQLMLSNLRYLSLVLGDKPFLLGNQASADDCAVFGMLAQALWADVGSPFEAIINGELTNLRDYCIRIKESFWPDWDQYGLKTVF